MLRQGSYSMVLDSCYFLIFNKVTGNKNLLIILALLLM